MLFLFSIALLFPPQESQARGLFSWAMNNSIKSAAIVGAGIALTHHKHHGKHYVPRSPRNEDATQVQGLDSADVALLSKMSDTSLPLGQGEISLKSSDSINEDFFNDEDEDLGVMKSSHTGGTFRNRYAARSRWMRCSPYRS